MNANLETNLQRANPTAERPAPTYLAPTLLADSDNARVAGLSAELTAGCRGDQQKADRIAEFVKNAITTGLTASGDETSASALLQSGMGNETAKATLVAALARAAGIPARIHVARFDKKICREVIPGWIHLALPQSVSIAWAELYVNGHWQPRPDAAYDDAFETGGASHLEEKSRSTGLGLIPLAASREGWTARLAHLPLAADEGTFRDVMDYLWSDAYPTPRSHPVIGWLLSSPLGRDEVGRKMARIRERGRTCTEQIAV